MSISHRGAGDGGQKRLLASTPEHPERRLRSRADWLRLSYRCARQLCGARRHRSFPEALHEFGHGDWSEFYDVCTTPAQISVRRPFFPNSCPVAGMCRQKHLTAALGLSWDELHRHCERKTVHRRAACPLFWTLGGNQVEKAQSRAGASVCNPWLRRATISVSGHSTGRW